MRNFNIIIWEGFEQDDGDQLRLLYSRDLNMVALHESVATPWSSSSRRPWLS
ncbi:MAG: hypothetical protein ACLQUT_02045 [Thermoleophilia bacterium]